MTTGLLVTWRAEYDVGDYHLESPRTRGCGIAIRPDLLESLIGIASQERLLLRDFIVGGTELLGFAPENGHE